MKGDRPAVVAEREAGVGAENKKTEKNVGLLQYILSTVIPHQESLGNELKDEGRVVGGFNKNGCCTRTLYTVQCTV